MNAPASKTTPAKTETSKTAKADYKVISPLELNKERFEPGAVVALTEKEAEPLLGHTVEPVAAA